MGIPTEIYRLYATTGDIAGKFKHILLCLYRDGYSNVDYDDEVRAQKQVDADESSLLETLGLSLSQCELLGESECYPVGELLSELSQPLELTIWVAQTKYGFPWIVLGTSESEEMFWHEINEDSYLSSFGPVAPAKSVIAYCVAHRPSA